MHVCAITDDLALRNFDADTGSIEAMRPMSIEKHFLLDHARTLYYTGRLFVEPKPKYTPNPSKFRNQFAMYPVLEPFGIA